MAKLILLSFVYLCWGFAQKQLIFQSFLCELYFYTTWKQKYYYADELCNMKCNITNHEELLQLKMSSTATSTELRKKAISWRIVSGYEWRPSWITMFTSATNNGGRCVLASLYWTITSSPDICGFLASVSSPRVPLSLCVVFPGLRYV